MVYGPEMLLHLSPRVYFSFIMRRIARVWPLLALAVLVGLIITGIKQGVTIPLLTTAAIDLLMLDGWGLAQSLGGPTWSVSTEFAAYLLFPALLWLALRSRHWVAALCGAIAFLPLLWLEQSFDQATSARHSVLDIYYDGIWPVLRCLAGFSLGLLAYRATHSAWIMAAAQHRAGELVVVALLVISFWTANGDLYSELLFPLLVICAVPKTTLVSRALSLRVPYILGVWSYSIYLVHVRFLGPEMRFGSLMAEYLGSAGPPISLALVWTAILATAALLFYTVETKGRRLLTSFSWLERHRDGRGMPLDLQKTMEKGV
jgi:peptidoglycan/LPS O-acetylase OafA/YrhL